MLWYKGKVGGAESVSPGVKYYKAELARRKAIATTPTAEPVAMVAREAAEEVPRRRQAVEPEEVTTDNVKEYLALAYTDNVRLTEFAGNHLSAIMAPIRVGSARVLNDRFIRRPEDVYMLAEDHKFLDIVTGKPIVEPVSMGDVIQFPWKIDPRTGTGSGRYTIPDFKKDGTPFAGTGKEVRAVWDEGVKLLDAAKLMAKREGIPIKEVIFDTTAGDAHYWPRFIAALKNTIAVISPTSGTKGRKKPSFMFGRLNELQAETIHNGNTLVGSGMKDPYSDVLELYLHMMLQQVANKRYQTELLALSPKITARIGADLAENIQESVETLERANAAKSVMDDVVKHLTDPQMKRPKTPVRTVSRFSSRLGIKVKAAMRIKDPSRKSATLKDIRAEADRMASDAKADKIRKELAVKQMKHQQLNPPGYRRIDVLGKQGLFRNDVADVIQKQLGPENVNALLRGVSTVSGVVRLGSLTLDAGFPFLQGAMIITSAPRTWVKSSVNALKAFAIPETRNRYLAMAGPQESLRVAGGRLHIGSQEGIEILREGSITRRFPAVQQFLTQHEKVRSIINLPIDQTFGRFATSYEMFFDTARIEMFGGYLPAIKAGQVGVAEAANYVNKMTGIISSRALGVGVTQREIESSLIFLAPRWTRSVIGMIGMALQGGWEAEQALLALTRFFGGTVVAYAAAAGALNKPIKLDPRDKKDGGDGGEFMTVEIGGAHVGLAGKPLSLARLLYRMRSSIGRGDPSEAIDHLERWYRGASAPATSTIIDFWKQETYMSDPLKTPEGTWDVSEIIKHEGGRLLPFYAQAFMDDPRPTVSTTTADFIGLKAWPVPVYERRNNLRNELAGMFPVESLMQDQRQGMLDAGLAKPTWEILTPGQKSRIQKGRTNISTIDERQGELDRLEKRSKEELSKRGDTHITDYFDDINDNIATLEDNAMGLARVVDKGEMTLKNFRLRMSVEWEQYSRLSDKIYDEDGDHREAIMDLNENYERAIKGGRFITDAEQAMQEYIRDVIGADDLVNEAGEYNYREAEKRKNAIAQKWGIDVLRDVEESFKDNKNMPQLWKSLVLDREELEDYWRIKENYIQRTPGLRSLVSAQDRSEKQVNYIAQERLKRNPLIRRMNSVTSQQRQMLRLRDPRLDALLYFWGYTQTLLTPQAYRILQELISERLGGRIEEPVASLTT